MTASAAEPTSTQTLLYCATVAARTETVKSPELGTAGTAREPDALMRSASNR